MKIIIAGSRTITDLGLVYKAFADAMTDWNITDGSNIEIVSGAAKGADKLGETLAEAYGFAVAIFPANWDLYGRRTGPIRNEEMGRYADALIAIRENNSRGTTHMIQYMKSLGKSVFVLDI